MKNLAYTLFALLAFGNLLNAQTLKEKNIPLKTRKALYAQYPGADHVKWEKENGNYEAAFSLKETDYSLVIDTAGHILETEKNIAAEELPENIRQYIAKNYPGKKIKSVARITDASGNVTYETEIKNRELFFDQNGNLLKTSDRQHD